MSNFEHKEIEAKWQERWDDDKLYKTGEDKNKEKFFILDMFPYPSGAGLHVGHPKGYIATDIFARLKMMQGYNVLHPMGWDAFGLPAENYALKNKVHPRVATEENISTFKSQLKKLGFTYDWEREINTTDPKFYKWTQWIFLQLFKKGLAYESHEPIIWCPSCQTGLANEDLEGGKCERCGSEVERKPMRQWVLRITDYAERMLNDLEKLPDWEDSIKEMQKNWIGRSEGAIVEFKIKSPELEQRAKSKAQKANREYFKFRTSMIEPIKNGEKTVTFRMEKKDIKAGDIVDIVDWAEGVKEDQCVVAQAKIKKAKEIKYKELPLDYPGHEDYSSLDERSKLFKDCYGKEVGDEEVVYIYEFELIKKGTILLIHGLEGTSEENWFPWFKKEMEASGYKVLIPDLPNSAMPVLEEWLSALNDKKEQFEGPLTIIGHSLGCPTACKFIDQEKLDVENLILVAPASERSRDRETLLTLGISAEQLDSMEEFKRAKLSYKNINDHVNNIVQVYSKDDPLISLDAQKDHEELESEIIIFEDKGHFSKVTGGIVEFPEIKNIIENVGEKKIKVFTTRPDTLFGATYFVLAPEHELIKRQESKIKNIDEVNEYIKKAAAKSELERTDLAKDKSGVRLEGIVAVNPINNEEIPIYVADYVLMGYGTGAIMAVPAHDERDWEFAKKYDLPIREVLKGGDVDKEAFTGDGEHVNSGFLDGLDKGDGVQKAIDWLSENKLGEKAINYKIKDWVFSRQRYWGEPIPIVHCDKCGAVALSEDELPLELPEVEHYEPSGTGESPLATIDDWVNTTCPECGGKAKRETNTMPQWAGSSWYYLRYIDPDNNEALVDKARDKYWSPVDFYVGGAEHATRHLIYARFWHKFLFDIGAVNYDEPFKRLQHVGLIMAEDGRKMSKRWGNVINPDDIVEKYGADAMRVYEMFMGPFSQAVSWSTNGLIGARKFLERVYRLKDKIGKDVNDEKLNNLLHKTIKKVGGDIEEFRFNTAISALMILVNEVEKQGKLSEEQYKNILLMLAPFAPHLTEELWSMIEGNSCSIFEEIWPKFDESLMKDTLINLVVQVNGKLRDTLEVEAEISEDEAKKIAQESEKVKKWIEGKNIVKIVYVKGKLVSIVVK